MLQEVQEILDVIFAGFKTGKKTKCDNADYQNGDGSKSVKFTKAGNIHVFRFSVLSRKGWEIFPYPHKVC